MIKTAEYCRKGHPDRLSDIIADSLLDEYLKQDPTSRVAIEVFGCHGIITVGGEVTSKANVNIPKIVKQVYHEIGYNDEIGVQVNIVKQSPEISNFADEGAGDSGVVTGYATRETKEMLPLEVVLAKRIADGIDDLKLDYIKPDGKIQVSIKNNKLLKIIVAVQTDWKSVILEIQEDVVKKVVGDYLTNNTEIIEIPFKRGGFEADTGLTGRKNILWYGPKVPTGGGSFAGKDPTKVDRSGAYWARKLAIEGIEKMGMQECLIEMAFMIGKNNPIMVKRNGEDICTISTFNILEELNLRRPIFKEASLKGHFGTNKFTWDIQK